MAALQRHHGAGEGRSSDSVQYPGDSVPSASASIGQSTEAVCCRVNSAEGLGVLQSIQGTC